MNRKGNHNPPTPPVTVVSLLPHEWKRLNPPYPPGGGGLQGMVNYAIASTDTSTLHCTLDDVHLARVIRYITSPTYGPGGPNQRLRDVFFPALRRIGIHLQQAPKHRKVAITATHARS